MAEDAKGYIHTRAEMTARPEIGAAPRFKAKKERRTFRYDSSLSPSLEWDSNPAREVAAFLMSCIEEALRLPSPHEFPERRVLRGSENRSLLEIGGLQDAVDHFKRLQRPFLNWAGKAEHAALDVPTLPLFVHERLSTEAVIRTLEAHQRLSAQADMFSLFADPQRPLAEQVRAFEHKDRWVNRMILGDSLVAMNSLVGYEGMGGQVQMIYMDPPYGVRFGSNFQPFVRKRDVGSDDADMTREPEMVQAYRDTWELGLHSYLTYLRDRLILCRELLSETGSLFLQISDENLHHARHLLDEVFGESNFCAVIAFQKTSGASSPDARVNVVGSICDFIVWYAKDLERMKYRQLFVETSEGKSFNEFFSWVEEPSGTRRKLTKDERTGVRPIVGRRFALDNLTSQNDNQMYSFEYEGHVFVPGKRGWRTTKEGMERLSSAGRLMKNGNSLRYVQYADDFPFSRLQSLWSDTGIAGFASDKIYVVQTNTKVVQRCLLMATDPGDLVLDPTCGSGTTAFVAEQWGRRWITMDTSRVPLTLARQRLLTATFPWFELKDQSSGPAGGFAYSSKRNRKGDEVGGIIPHLTLKSIANSEPVSEEILVDRPNINDRVTRVSGPFVVEALLPPPKDLGDSDDQQINSSDREDNVARLIEVLRRSPEIRLPGGRKVLLKNVRPPARTMALSAEAYLDGDMQSRAHDRSSPVDVESEANLVALPFSSAPVAILFGPESGPVTAKAVLEAAKEANVKGYQHLFIIGFAITPEARREIEGGEDALGLPATWVTATMDLQMGDLLKNQRSSEIFSVCGLPEIVVKRLPSPENSGTPRWQVQLLGLDVFDPATMETYHSDGNDVPAWMLDTNWNSMAFHGDQVFFPRTSAWEDIRKALKATHEESVWAHLAGDTSAPFVAEIGTEIAVKVIDDRGNELLVTKKLGA